MNNNQNYYFYQNTANLGSQQFNRFPGYCYPPLNNGLSPSNPMAYQSLMHPSPGMYSMQLASAYAPYATNGVNALNSHPIENQVYSANQNRFSGSTYQHSAVTYHQPKNSNEQKLVSKKKKTIQIPQECKSCNKSFPNVKSYENHLSQHVKCPQCEFSASKKVVKEHEQSIHGVFPETKSNKEISFIKKGEDSPEDIEKWRSERRKNYPTQENIERKKLEKEERMNNAALSAEYHRQKAQELEQVLEKAEKFGHLDKSLKTEILGGVEMKAKKRCLSLTDKDEEFKQKKARKVKCKYYARGSCSKEDKCPFIHDSLIPPSQSSRKTLREKFIATESEKQMSMVLEAIGFLHKLYSKYETT